LRQVSLRGEGFWVHDNEDLSNHIVRENDFFEAEILDFLKEHFNNQRVIIDIGANIGNHAIYFSRYLKHTHIYAFEPIPANYELLLKNCEGRSDIIPSNIALSDKAEIIPMTANSRNMGMSGWDKNGVIGVTAYTLDFLNLDDVTMIKIDVENYEPQVLAGAKKTIERFKPVILIEDNFNTYGNLLLDYTLLRGWEISKTYLYVPT